MRISFTLILIACFNFQLSSQVLRENIGKIVPVDLTILESIRKGDVSKSKASFELPMPNGISEVAELYFTSVSESQPSNILTYSGKTLTTNSALKITFSDYGFSAIIHFEGRYHFIEQDKKNREVFRMYSLKDVPKGVCNVNEHFHITERSIKHLAKSIAPFPVGGTMRRYRMAAAATGEMTALYSTQAAASAQIVSIINAANLIYELEASVTFDLISKSTTSPYQIIFSNAASDPFTPQGGASAFHSQVGFTTMNGNGTLLYSEYDIGHTFHSTASGGGGYSASGQAGPDPCVDGSKSRAWSQFTVGAPLGFITSLVVHEMGHQFSAWHTFNGNSGLCATQWSSTAAVEPGSGSTLMAYGDNCSQAPNYVLTEPNEEDYFHTKSLEQIYNTVAGDGACITTTSTGNNPPSADAGDDLSIPKGTPFMLTGTASDPDGNSGLTYVWDQFDVATSSDRGALGSSINGVGSYPAVQSTMSAPLFRSKMSSSPSRYFPDLSFVLNNANNPDDNEGEDLPQASRNMTFRFTVRDNEAGGGGVDSDQMEITVDSTKGPFELTSQNSAITVNAGNNLNITWSVNSTNLISPNVKISLSVDGGTTFPFVLVSSTANDGNYVYAVPASAPSTSEARIKISSTHHPTAEFFDINNSDFTISGGSCAAQNSYLCPVQNINAQSGDGALDLDENLKFLFDNIVSTIDLDLSGNAGSSPVANSGDPSSCALANFVETHGSFEFFVTQTGSYTFTPSTWGLISIFETDNYDFSNRCGATFLGSNTTSSGSIQSSFTDSLFECTIYTAVVGSPYFSASTTNPVSVSGPSQLYENLSTAPSTSYTHIAIDKANNVIDKVSSTADFQSLSAGNYEVYGVSYLSSINAALWETMNADNVFTLATCAYKSLNYHTLTVTAPPCSITGVTAGSATCNASNVTFSITAFTPSGGSGSYEVVDAGDVVRGSGSGAPIIVTIPNPVSAGSQNFRVRDANNVSCISAAISVSLPQCPPPCSITSVMANASATCNGQDAEFNVTAFTANNGSGSYQVINSSDQVVGSGTMAPISALVTGPTSSGSQDFRVRDANDNSCVSSTVSVSIPTCILPCNAASPAVVNGSISSDTLWTKTYLMSAADVSSGNVKFQARDSVILGNNFEVNTNGVFEVQIGDCDDNP